MMDGSDLPTYIRIDPNNPIINIDRVENGLKFSIIIKGFLDDGSNSSEKLNINISPINKPPFFE